MGATLGTADVDQPSWAWRSCCPAVLTFISPIRKIREISDIDVPGRNADADAEQPAPAPTDDAESPENADAVLEADPDPDGLALATSRLTTSGEPCEHRYR